MRGKLELVVVLVQRIRYIVGTWGGNKDYEEKTFPAKFPFGRCSFVTELWHSVKKCGC